MSVKTPPNTFDYRWNTTTSTFDYEDRLTGIGANVTYSYIGASTDRYSKTVSGTTTQFLYDNGQVTEELQGSTYTNIYGAAAEKLSGTVYWMLSDGQPSTRQLLNSSQTVVDTYTTDAFGNSVASTGTAVNPFQWNAGGKYYSDYESGLQKVGARYYEPATGRWICQDRLVVAGSAADSQAVNRFLYCGANPVAHDDVTGLTTDGETRDRLKKAGGVGLELGAVLIALGFVTKSPGLIALGTYIAGAGGYIALVGEVPTPTDGGIFGTPPNSVLRQIGGASGASVAQSPDWPPNSYGSSGGLANCVIDRGGRGAWANP